MQIPEEHWSYAAGPLRQYIPGWERLLLARIAAEPDPAKRFDGWLSRMVETGGDGMPGVRVVFVEQPYLGWAEKIQKTIEFCERKLRQQIAHEIQNPDME